LSLAMFDEGVDTLLNDVYWWGEATK